MTLLEALAIIQDRITKGTAHKHYDRVKKWAKLYEQLISGEDQEELLKRFVKREDEAMFKQRQELTQTITPAVCASIKAAFNKVHRTAPNVMRIAFAKDGETKAKELSLRMSTYYENKDVENYMNTRFYNNAFSDPNMFIVSEFKPFDPTKGKAAPYPFEVTSTEAVNFKYENGVLQFLLVEQSIKFTNHEKKEVDGTKLIIYIENDGFIFTEVAKTEDNVDGLKYEGKDETKPFAFVNKDRRWTIEAFNHKTGYVPAYRIGYVPDEKTKGETYVNPFHYGALPFLMKMIKSVSEADLTESLHDFPQKVQYGERCKFDITGNVGQSQKCQTSGQAQKDCKMCGGMGIKTHTSAQDMIWIELPKPGDDKPLGVDELIKYISPPTEQLKWQQEYIQMLKTQCYSGVFNSETFSKTQIAGTATESGIQLQNVYDALSDYGHSVAGFYIFANTTASRHLDYSDITVEYKYPRDFKMKSVSALIIDLKGANDSGASTAVVAEIETDIERQLFVDKPNELLKCKVKRAHQPFAGKTRDEISMLINLGHVLDNDVVLYTYFDAIMNRAEIAAMGAGGIWFYDMTFEKRQTLIDTELKKVTDALALQRPAIELPSASGGGQA